MIKRIAHYYIKKTCQKACNGNATEYRELQELMFKTIRETDTESNDSSIYSWMLDEFDSASRYLIYVSKGLRK
jgi:hypothetical protein